MDSPALAQLKELIRAESSALGRYVCPLYQQERGNGCLIGSGVPLRLGQAAFLVTASHVLRAFEDRYVYTLGADDAVSLEGERRVVTHRKRSTIDVDLALIVLRPHEADQLQRRFSFTYQNDLASAFGAAAAMELHILLGYPCSKNKPTPQSRYETTANIAFYPSRTIASVETSVTTGKHELVHFALAAPGDQTQSLSGGSARPPKAQGVSGGGVWKVGFDPAAQKFFMPQLVGIGIEHDAKIHRFICTHICHLLPMVQDLVDAELVDSLKRRLTPARS